MSTCSWVIGNGDQSRIASSKSCTVDANCSNINSGLVYGLAIKHGGNRTRRWTSWTCRWLYLRFSCGILTQKLSKKLWSMNAISIQDALWAGERDLAGFVSCPKYVGKNWLHHGLKVKHFELQGLAIHVLKLPSWNMHDVFSLTAKKMCNTEKSSRFTQCDR